MLIRQLFQGEPLSCRQQNVFTMGNGLSPISGVHPRFDQTNSARILNILTGDYIDRLGNIDDLGRRTIQGHTLSSEIALNGIITECVGTQFDHFIVVLG